MPPKRKCTLNLDLQKEYSFLKKSCVDWEGMDGFGAISWWGFSPALDLQTDSISSSNDELNVLMVGMGDCRHIIKTLARSYRHSPRKVNFYVIESNLELYARHMLLVCLALEPQRRFGLQDKTELLLEIHANSLVRDQTMDYVVKMSNNFIRMVTDFDYLAATSPIFDLSNLKFKERDMLEGIFKFWRNPDPKLFDIAKCWDLRLRQNLGVRYDAIPNVFDWDFHMKLVDRKAGIINSRNYLRWRHKGIAYEIRDATYGTTNKTLASGMVFKHEGDRLARRGYWGDIVVGPYIAFGIESEEESFFKMANNVYTKTSEDVAEYNIMSMLHEILHREKYCRPTEAETKDEEESSDNGNEDKENKAQSKTNEEEKAKQDKAKETDALGTEQDSVIETGTGDTKATESKAEETTNEAKRAEDSDGEAIGTQEPEVISETVAKAVEIGSLPKDAGSTDTKHPLDMEYVQVSADYAKIYFLSINSVPEMIKKSKFQQFFNLIYLSNSMAHLMNADLMRLCSDSAQVIVETARFMLELSKEQVEEFNEKVIHLCDAAGCQRVTPAENKEDEGGSHLRFVYNRSKVLQMGPVTAAE